MCVVRPHDGLAKVRKVLHACVYWVYFLDVIVMFCVWCLFWEFGFYFMLIKVAFFGYLFLSEYI